MSDAAGGGRFVKLRQPYRNHLLEAYTTGGQP